VATETWTDLRTGSTRQTLYGYAFYANNAIASVTTTQVLPGGNATTTLAYDTLGNLSSATNPLGHQVNFANYNGLGLPGRMTDANGVMTDYVYDAKGNLASSVQYLANGNRTTMFTFNNDR